MTFVRAFKNVDKITKNTTGGIAYSDTIGRHQDYHYKRNITVYEFLYIAIIS